VIPTDRLEQILKITEAQGIVTNATLAEKLNVSLMTVRRDIIELEHRGLLRRVHGGVQSAASPDRGFSLRSRQQQTAKHAIGAAAALLVQDFETIYLDAGSTAFELALSLRQRPVKGVRVVTHAINIAAELAGLNHIGVVQIGGEVFGQTFAATGPLAIQAIRTLSFHQFFISAQGFDLENGLTDSNLLEVEVKQAVLTAAKKVVLIADSSKWGVTSFARVADLGVVSKIVTDSGINLKDQEALTEKGLLVSYV
jgi:DeoR family transcriptional regulator, fructose operon transcriptional repressor